MAIETLEYTGLSGSPATPGSTGYDSIIETAGQMSFDDSWKPRGSTVSVRSVGDATSGGLYGSKGVSDSASFAIDSAVTPIALPASGELAFMFVGSGTGSTRSVALVTTSSGLVRVRDAANGNAWSSDPGVLEPDTPCVISLYLTPDGSDGTFRVAVFEEDGITPRADSGLQTGQNTGGGDIVRFRGSAAKASTSDAASEWLWGEPRWDSQATGLLPAWEAPSDASPAYIWTGTEYAPLDCYRWDGSQYAPVDRAP